jgi:hypothetical protein
VILGGGGDRVGWQMRTARRLATEGHAGPFEVGHRLVGFDSTGQPVIVGRRKVVQGEWAWEASSGIQDLVEKRPVHGRCLWNADGSLEEVEGQLGYPMSLPPAIPERFDDGEGWGW